ncbi:hypothetical protein [Streptosporangium sp. NPDC050280]|uniref:hypothetical protein n=1 Tax=unclassified Streptosporangium TaxID=2632669 RepID=UPI00341A44CB
MAVTTSQDVLKLFKVTSLAEAVFQRWISDTSKAEVVPHVMEHRTSVVYDLTPASVESVCRATAHALGNVKRVVAERERAIVDWHPPFAFTHTLHYALETLGHLPTWQEFSVFARDDAKGHHMLWGPAIRVASDVHHAWGGPSWDDAWDGVRWRVGNAYYSFLREIYVVAHLRASGLDVRVHPLADALFRVDFWSGRTACSLLIKNAKFKEGDQGRKIPTDRILEGAEPGFRFHKIQLEPATEFGVVRLPSSEDIHRVADVLRASP